MDFNIDERAARARQFFLDGYNCAQAVAMAWADCCSVDELMAAKMTLALGGGVGRQREVCGTVSGAAVVIGAVQFDTHDTQAKAQAYRLVQQHGKAFRSENGSIVCRELLALAKGQDDGPEPSPRTEHYYLRRPCADYVESSSRILGRVLRGV